ncbi:MAG TPA: signal peptidase I [Thermoanaerobaculia bacterium]|nr:signal peptidase I [Thermoanaerobaculia bacterium]
MDKKKIINEIRVFALMLLVVTSLRSALADWNDVPTGSMKPTIQEGDRVVVNKLAYDLKIPFTTYEVAKWGDPHRGDIVVLFSPRDGVRLVKRVIAVPGDTVQLVENELAINGKKQQQSEAMLPMDDPQQGRIYITDENLDGHEHKVMLSPQLPSPMRTYGPEKVPPGMYFVMGDNRDNSNDSRYIGLIPRRQIVGRALAVAFSLDRNHYYVPRFDRFFQKLH